MPITASYELGKNKVMDSPVYFYKAKFSSKLSKSEWKVNRSIPALASINDVKPIINGIHELLIKIYPIVTISNTDPEIINASVACR